MAEPTLQHEPETLSELDYFRRNQPPRDRGHETGATLLAALAFVIGLSALYFRPFKPGFAAMLLALIALTIAGERDRLPRLALLVATLCWLIGGLIAVWSNAAVW